MARIFISYRRDDNRDFVEHLADRLKSRFGKHAIFQDVVSMPAAVDFREYLRQTVKRYDIMLLIIGPQWSRLLNAAGGRRLDDDLDPVRLEVEAALACSVPIIPVLVAGADMPSETDLPATLRKVASLNARRVRRNPDFDPDVHTLVQAIHQARLTRVRRGRKATRRYLSRHSSLIKRIMVVAAAAVLVGLSGIALVQSNLLQQLAWWGRGPGVGQTSVPATAAIDVGWSSRHAGYLAVTLRGFPHGSYLLSCTFVGEKGTTPTVSQFAVVVVTDPQTFDDGRTCHGGQAGDEAWVTYETLVSTTLVAPDVVAQTTATTASATPSIGVPETVSDLGAHSWSNYLIAGGTAGPYVSPSATVLISCKVQGFKVQDGNVWWYRIAQSPWNNEFYASADAFYNNGQTSGSLSGTPFIDTRVPNC